MWWEEVYENTMKDFTNKKISKNNNKATKLNDWILTSSSEETDEEIFEKFKNKF